MCATARTLVVPRTRARAVLSGQRQSTGPAARPRGVATASSRARLARDHRYWLTVSICAAFYRCFACDADVLELTDSSNGAVLRRSAAARSR